MAVVAPPQFTQKSNGSGRIDTGLATSTNYHCARWDHFRTSPQTSLPLASTMVVSKVNSKASSMAVTVTWGSPFTRLCCTREAWADTTMHERLVDSSTGRLTARH